MRTFGSRANLDCEEPDLGQLLHRFACTQCGKCCNRSPEVELSEAAGLADVFAFRLMFRIYCLPNRPRDDDSLAHDAASATAIFYERKRLLGAFAARKYSVKRWRGGKAIECTNYLMISALALDTSPGACSALNGSRCGIYDRRPLGCRSVPFHYSRPEALAGRGLKAFVESPGYRCDTSEAAEVVLKDQHIVAPQAVAARSEALAVAERDRPWSAAIARRLNSDSSATGLLPTLKDIEGSAQFGATTTSMGVAWRIAADIALIGAEECDALTERQLSVIDRELAAGRCSQESRETLRDMGAEYRHRLRASPASTP